MLAETVVRGEGNAVLASHAYETTPVVGEDVGLGEPGLPFLSLKYYNHTNLEWASSLRGFLSLRKSSLLLSVLRMNFFFSLGESPSEEGACFTSKQSKES